MFRSAQIPVQGTNAFVPACRSRRPDPLARPVPMLSQIALSIAESATLKLNETAALLRDKGEPVIHLGGGEPKSRAPIDAIIGCTSILNTGEVRYTPADGIAALKKAIIRYTEQHYGRAVAPENVIASSGAKQSIMVALQAMLDPNDEVIVPVPYWVSYPEMVKLAGGVPVPVRAADGSFEPAFEDVAQAVGPYTRAILLNSPNNPSGAVYSEDFVRRVVELCEQKDIWLVMDDTYNRLVFDGRQASNACAFTGEDVDRSKLVIVNSVSKMYAMTGFRVGWAVGNRDLVRVMTNIQSQQTSGPATPSQWAAVGALNGVQNCVDALCQTLQNNRDVMIARLRAIPGVKVTRPAGTFYAFPDFSAYEKDSQKLAAFLLEKVRVVTVPGREFGMDGHLRLSYCGTLKEIKEGIERIQWALDPHAPNELFLGSRKLTRDWL